MKAKDMVVCVVFTGPDYGHREVVLQEKLRPAAQKGLWNFPGGHVEEGESPEVAASREFKEECGMEMPSMVWDIVGSFRAYSEHGECRVWVCKTDIREEFKPLPRGVGDELYAIFDVTRLPGNIMPNIPYLLNEALKYHEGWEPAEKFLQTP